MKWQIFWSSYLFLAPPAERQRSFSNADSSVCRRRPSSSSVVNFSIKSLISQKLADNFFSFLAYSFLMPRSHIHRAPHDCSCPVLPGGLPWILETVGLPCEFNFCGVCGHIFYDVRAVPFKNWKSLIVRCP